MRIIASIAMLGSALSLVACGGGGGSSAPAAPTATISASPTSVDRGSTVSLTWSSTNANSCTASGGWTGDLASSGNKASAAITADTTYSLTCTGAGGTSSRADVTVTVKAPTVTFTTSADAVDNGGTVTLTWSSTSATSCTASGGWTGTLATSGTQTSPAITADTTFSITCTGPKGTTAVKSVTVDVKAATVTLSVSPPSIASGATSTLTWSSTSATSCTATGGWTGTLAASGTKSTGVLMANTTFYLTCTGPGGTSSQTSAAVTIAAGAMVPTATLSATPSVVASGETSLLTWSSTNATHCDSSFGDGLATGGTFPTPALTATTTYTLTCTGTGGTTTSKMATVTVNNTPISVAPSVASITLSRAQKFTVKVPGGGLATWAVDTIAGGNSTVGTVDSTGLFTSGTAAGAHAVTATSVANTSQVATATIAVTDLEGVYTYHNNIARDGANTQEYALTPTTVNTTHFARLTSCFTDGAIYTQPLWVANLTFGGAKHNVVLVATQHDSLYAFDADAAPCVKLWSVSLIDATHGGTTGETPVNWLDVGNHYGDIQPEIGVTGTPVIDPSANILYVVSKSVDAGLHYYQRLHAIDLLTGSEKTGSPETIAGTYPGSGDGGANVTFDPHQELQRTGLALLNGVVYIAWSSHEDNAPWYGWLMGYQYGGSGFTQQSVFNVSPNAQESGIWMSGGAPAADSSNHLYLLTGNGTFNANAGGHDYGDTLLQFATPNLSVLDYFTPHTQASDNPADLDFGAGGAAVLADLPSGSTVQHALICGGKGKILYVINRDNLGGYNSSADTGAVQANNFGNLIFSTASIWNNHLYMAGAGGPLRDYALNTSNAQFTLSKSSATIYKFPGATPSTSAAANQNGVVWSLDTNRYCTDKSSGGQVVKQLCGPAILYAHDASNVTNKLWDSTQAVGDAAGFPVKFAVPTVANGKVYVGTRGNNQGDVDTSTSSPGQLEIYGLKSQ